MPDIDGDQTKIEAIHEAGLVGMDAAPGSSAFFDEHAFIRHLRALGYRVSRIKPASAE